MEQLSSELNLPDSVYPLLKLCSWILKKACKNTQYSWLPHSLQFYNDIVQLGHELVEQKEVPRLNQRAARQFHVGGDSILYNSVSRQT
jgi:hypothetical protein